MSSDLRRVFAYAGIFRVLAAAKGVPASLAAPMLSWPAGSLAGSPAGGWIPAPERFGFDFAFTVHSMKGSGIERICGIVVTIFFMKRSGSPLPAMTAGVAAVALLRAFTG